MPNFTQLPQTTTVNDSDKMIIDQNGITIVTTIGTLLSDAQPKLTLAPNTLLGRVGATAGGPEPILVGSGLLLSSGTLQAVGRDALDGGSAVAPATRDLAGVVKPGNGLNVSADGTLSAAVVSVAGRSGAVALEATDIVGLAKVAISGNFADLVGVPAAQSSYVLPTATATSLGGVKPGVGLSIATDGTTSLSTILPAADAGALTVAGVQLSQRLAAMCDVVADYGADPTGRQDSTRAFNAAFASGRPVNIPAGNFEITGTVTVPESGIHVQGAGMGVSTISWACAENLFVLGATDSIRSCCPVYFSGFTVQGNLLSNKNSIFNSSNQTENINVPFLISTTSNVRIEKIEILECPFFGITIQNCKCVDITDNVAKFIARDCYSVRNSFVVNISGNSLNHSDDDAVSVHMPAPNGFGNQAFSGHSLTISNNRFSDCGGGISGSNLKQASITGNVLDRVRQHGIRVGCGSNPLSQGDGAGTGIAVSITGNTITNMINPLSQADSPVGDYIIATGTSCSGSLPSIPGQNNPAIGAVTELYSVIYENKSIGAAAGSYGLTITGNILMRTRPVGVNYSSYGEGLVFTRTGWIDPLITAGMLSNGRGIALIGTHDQVTITGNVIRGACFGIQLAALSASDTQRNIIVNDNNFSEINTAGVEISPIGSAVQQITIDGCVFDADPSRVSPGRLTTNSASWSAGAYPCAVATNGAKVILNRSIIRNMACPADNLSCLSGEGNIIYAAPIATGYNIGNLGVGNCPPAGAMFRYIVINGSVSSTAYETIITDNANEAAVLPYKGIWVAGHFVRNTAPVITSGVTCLGWLRLTTGSGHVDGADWVTISVSGCAVTGGQVLAGPTVGSGMPTFRVLTGSDIAGLAKVATTGSYLDLTNTPVIPSTYVLPPASSTVLGGVKPGVGTNISADGTLSVSLGLIPATSTGLGVVKPGAGTNVMFDGTLSLNTTQSFSLINSNTTLDLQASIGAVRLWGGGSVQVSVSGIVNAVNIISLAGATFGNGPTVTASGSDTNIDLNLAGKGGGGVVVAGQFRKSVQSGMSAGSTDAQGAFIVGASSIMHFTTVNSINSVTLSEPGVGAEIFIINRGTSTLKVYVPNGQLMQGGQIYASVLISSARTFRKISSNLWDVI